MLKIKRVYDPAEPEDGVRILIDRLWPRGLSKDRAQIDEWRKDLAPSDELRKWFGHQPEKWEEFKRRYRQELEQTGAIEDLRLLAQRAQRENITLVFAASDEEHSNAAFLRELVALLATDSQNRTSSSQP